MLYFQTATDEDDIYQDIGESEDVQIAPSIKSLSENEGELFSTAESSQVDGTGEDNHDLIDMTESHLEAVDEEMKEVIEKLDQDLHRIVQISDEIGKAMSANESEQITQMQQDEQNGNQEDLAIEKDLLSEIETQIDEMETTQRVTETEEEEIETKDKEEALETEAGEEESLIMNEYLEEENLNQLDHEEPAMVTDEIETNYENTNVQMDDLLAAVPMAVEEDDEDFNDIDYIDEEFGALSDDQESMDDMQRPFSADIFERHVQKVIEEDFPDNGKKAIAPAVQIISSKLNQIMSREAAAAKVTSDAVSPYEVLTPEILPYD